MSDSVRVGTRRIYYGWVIVAALSVTETVTWGIVYYGFPVFLRPMEAELGASRVAVTAAFSIGLGVSALAGIPVGRWIDAHGPRGIMTLGSCLACVLTFAWAHVQSVAALYAVWFGLGLAMAATLYEPAFAAVVSWFRQGRERALLTVTLVAGLASTIFMPIEAWLLERLGWRAALMTLAVVLAVITIPIHALLLRRGTAAHATATSSGAGAPSSMTLGEAARTLVFWVLFVAFFVGNFATASITTHLIPYLVEHGYSAAVAAAVIGWTGAMQLPGRMLFVPISARLGARTMVGAVFFARRSASASCRFSCASARSSRSSCCRAPPTAWRPSRAPRRSRRSSARATTAPSAAPSRSAPTARGRWGRSARRCSSSLSART